MSQTVREYAERYRTLGLRIAYYRRLADYTQETFAEKIDRSVNFIAQVEGPGTVKGVSLDTLFAGLAHSFSAIVEYIR